ncbi:MAG: hypothetical protein JWO71_3622 [Candidatus Acidoferrum typicum]|nr:hypothetical protein [Candidatus Acidoferrum typicum]
MPKLRVLNILNYFRNGTCAKTWIKRRDGAERARERTPTGRLHNALDEKSAREQIIAGSWDSIKRKRLAYVTLAKSSVRGVRQQFGPDCFSFTDHDAVTVFQHLIWGKGSMRSASDNALTAFLKLAGETIGFRGETTKKGECDQVCRGVEVDWFNLFVNDADLITRRSDRSKVDASDWWDEMSFMAEQIALHIDDYDFNSQPSRTVRLIIS